ncbi:hypothetical protein D3C75_1068570 [compost metagenome]
MLYRQIQCVGGQWRGVTAAYRADQLQQALLHGFQLRAAVLHHSIAAFEPQQQAEVNQFQQLDVFARALRQLGQQLEELLSTPGFVVESDQQPAAGPDAAAAPGR